MRPTGQIWTQQRKFSHEPPEVASGVVGRAQGIVQGLRLDLGVRQLIGQTERLAERQADSSRQVGLAAYSNLFQPADLGGTRPVYPVLRPLLPKLDLHVRVFLARENHISRAPSAQPEVFDPLGSSWRG